jgi:hypothetical protein
MPVNKNDVTEAPSGASSRVQIVPWILSKLVVNTPLIICCLVVIALVWGVGARVIYEMFMFGWNLLGWS